MNTRLRDDMLYVEVDGVDMAFPPSMKVVEVTEFLRAALNRKRRKEGEH